MTRAEAEILIVLAVLVFAGLGTVIYQIKLRQIANTAPRLSILESGLKTVEQDAAISATVAVIIPAYNEVDNIADCVISVLGSTTLSAERLELWVVDDQSTDETLAIVQTLQTTLNDPRLKVLVGQPRPQSQVWMGKNWACIQATNQISREFLLFLDADVRLKVGAIETALDRVQREQIDLLTCLPAIVCGCLAEWLVQPLIVSLLVAGSDFNAVNDPNSETAFAVGPFMLFRRSAYDQIGGHQAVAAEVVEDVELARRLKQHQLKLKYMLGDDLASVRMYRSWVAVWEGWTKNWYLGSRRNLRLTLYSAMIVFLICTTPWLGLVGILIKGLTVGMSAIDWIAVVIALTTVLLQFSLRQTIEQISTIPPRYWWLTGVGGLVVAAIALASIIKTETGWGWTWRGRSLMPPVTASEVMDSQL